VIFALLSRAIGPAAALAIGAVVSAGLIVNASSIFAVRLVVDAGLLVIVLASMALGRPFTLQYARRQMPQQYWTSPRFLRANTIIASAWAVAFLIMVIAEAAVVFISGLPEMLGIIAVVAALAGGVGFTLWYPSTQA